MKYSAVSALLASLIAAAPAAALDGYVVEIGGGDDIQSVRIGMIRQWDKQWLTEGRWHLTGYWEGSVGYINSDGPDGQGAADLAFAPIFRFRPNASGGTQPYWDVALNLHLLSRTKLDAKHDLNGAVQLAPLVGVGVTFGEKSQYDLGYRYQHISSAGLNDSDDALKLHQVRLTYLY